MLLQSIFYEKDRTHIDILYNSLKAHDLADHAGS